MNCCWLPYISSISELQIFIYDDSYIGQSAPACWRAPAAMRGSGCPIYESSYIKICNSKIELLYAKYLFADTKHILQEK